jgi:Cdc6-like AAA superfamily ATPase
MIQNPFVYFEPVKGHDFSNREEIIHEISRITFQSKQQGNVWVVGERQVGKTSLLQRIERSYQDEHPIVNLYGTGQEFKVLFIYFNCQIIRESNGFYQNLTQCFANQFDFKIEEKENPDATFINWLKHIYEKKYYIVFLLDEFDAFIEKFTRRFADDAAHFLDTFNVLKQDIPGLKDKRKAFGVVCASNCTYGELTENLDLSGSGLTFVQEIELSNFTEKQVFDMANQYLDGNPIQFSESEIQFCYKMTHGYPLFAQHLFSIMYEEKTKKPDRPDKDFLKVVKSEYGKAFKKTVEDWEKQKKLTHRTKLKLKAILEDTKDEIKDVASTVITKIIEGS